MGDSPHFRHNVDHPDEKDESTKWLIRSKIDEYLARADTLKQHLAAAGGSRDTVGW